MSNLQLFLMLVPYAFLLVALGYALTGRVALVRRAPFLWALEMYGSTSWRRRRNSPHYTLTVGAVPHPRSRLVEVQRVPGMRTLMFRLKRGQKSDAVFVVTFTDVDVFERELAAWGRSVGFSMNEDDEDFSAERIRDHLIDAHDFVPTDDILVGDADDLDALHQDVHDDEDDFQTHPRYDISDVPERATR